MRKLHMNASAIHNASALHAPPRLLAVFYDGSCPLCVKEIAFYRRRRGADAIDWIDVSAGDGAGKGSVMAAPGLTRCDAMARFHVMDARGALHSGGDAFARLWSALPAFSLIGRLTRLQPIGWALNRAYDGFLRLRPQLRRLFARGGKSTS